MSDKKATLNIDGIDEAIELPIYSGTIGPDVVDVGSLTGKGMFTYDPGFVSTAACESQITYIDGGKGELSYRGYSIHDLATQSTFEEVAYLVLNGELPKVSQLKAFHQQLTHNLQIDLFDARIHFCQRDVEKRRLRVRALLPISGPLT